MNHSDIFVKNIKTSSEQLFFDTVPQAVIQIPKLMGTFSVQNIL